MHACVHVVCMRDRCCVFVLRVVMCVLCVLGLLCSCVHVCGRVSVCARVFVPLGCVCVGMPGAILRVRESRVYTVCAWSRPMRQCAMP